MKETIEKALALQKKLHRIPEASGCETQTKKTLIAFLKAESNLKIVDCGKWCRRDRRRRRRMLCPV